MGWKPLPFEIGYVAPVVGNGWTNREAPTAPGALAEYASHRPSGENVAEGGDGDWMPPTGVTFLSVSDTAEIDETLAAKYPYQRAYLPVNRLQHDGTLWNW